MPPSEDDDYISKTTLLIDLDHNFKTLITSKTLWITNSYSMTSQSNFMISNSLLTRTPESNDKNIRSNNINYIFLNFKTWKNNIAIYYIYYMLCIVIENFV